MNLENFRKIAILEGVSWLLLLVTMGMKYGMDIYWPNKIVGYAHGFLFIAYVFFLLYFLYTKKWKFGFGVLAFVASLLPFGTFYLDKKYLKNM
ncbi:integral membrane protein [Lishizhenia tianjinensis]|uniref:Integral membrane protein n=1 Tax=Lishizhenia tianjinensis TaxID=477690 RepID=A0A1I6XXR2_9FLAO|nr:DUF3817 domain-containing protein [Lishizhenia tianjinensis]SFT42604.1 integral membrane protein [Lishizhenia tianjinensis]